jgi:hypothetical protein
MTVGSTALVRPRKRILKVARLHDFFAGATMFETVAEIEYAFQLAHGKSIDKREGRELAAS